MPYVYFLKNKTTGLKYVGVRYKKGCDPSDFWISYFTSSKSVHKLINKYGKNDFIFRIIKCFEKSENAILFEEKLLHIAVNRKDYLNKWHYKAPYRDLCKLAGSIGGNKQKLLKLGIHKQTREERLEILKNARQIQLEKKKNAFIHCDKSIQSARGKRGGIKNRGSYYYNDGYNNFKFKTEKQELALFEKFLLEHPEFKKGRIRNWLK